MWLQAAVVKVPKVIFPTEFALAIGHNLCPQNVWVHSIKLVAGCRERVRIAFVGQCHANAGLSVFVPVLNLWFAHLSTGELFHEAVR